MLRRSLMLLRRQTGGRKRSMHRPEGRCLRPRELALLGALAVLAVVLVQSGSARLTDIKRYDVCLQYKGAPACTESTLNAHSVLPGGSTAHLTLMLTNEESSNQTLGSANINAPSQIQIVTTGVTAPPGTLGTITSGQIQLRNLNLSPGSPAVTVGFDVKTPCAGSNLTWTVPAKQSNNFLGTGNDFSLIKSWGLTTDITTGSCHLEWVTQPKSAAVNTKITGTAFTPTSTSNVAVKAVDAGGKKVDVSGTRVTLTKTTGTFNTAGGLSCLAGVTTTPCGTQANLSHGVATFSSLTSTATGTGLKLKASASGFGASDPSGAF